MLHTSGIGEVAMKRRDALKLGLGLALSAPVFRLATQEANATSHGVMRFTKPTDKNWPSQQEWAQLAQQLDGSIEPCVQPVTAKMAANGGILTDAIKQELQNPFLIQSYSGGTQSAGWYKGWVSQPSASVVIPKNANDVSRAVKFARRHQLRVVIKGGAHSYLGQSNAPDSLMIWTRDLRGLTLHDNFIPQGCKVKGRRAVSVASGEKFIDLYDYVVRRHGLYVQGGGCTSVGVGGHLQTGGFGSFSKYGGLTCANLLEAEIVTADGTVRVANECQNADLFWALKGGGAGWGITTRLTIATQDLPARFGFLGLEVKASNDAHYRALVSQFLTFARDRLINPIWGEQVSFKADNTLDIQMSFQGLEEKAAEETWKPFLQWIEAQSSAYTIISPLRVVVMPARHWWDFEYRKANYPKSIVIDRRDGKETGRFWWSGNTGEVGIFLTGYESLWLPKDLLSRKGLTQMTDAIMAASRSYVTTFHFNKGLYGATEARRKEARHTSINPKVMDAFALVIIAGGQTGTFPGVAGSEPDEKAAANEADRIAKAFSAFRQIAPHAGSYSSEMGYNEPDWQRAAWGENYKRLLQIKKKYDPDGFFTGHHQVGSELKRNV